MGRQDMCSKWEGVGVVVQSGRGYSCQVCGGGDHREAMSSPGDLRGQSTGEGPSIILVVIVGPPRRVLSTQGLEIVRGGYTILGRGRGLGNC